MNYVVAENYLCFYALLEMVLFDVGIKKFRQYDLANEFGVVVPNGYSIPNVYKNVSFSDDVFNHGAHIDKDKINCFFKINNIGLKMSYQAESIWSEHDYDKYMCSPIEEKRYYIYAFSYGYLYNESRNYRVGHVALLLNCKEGNLLEIYDPGPRNAGKKTVNRNIMHDAMDEIYGGVYFIELE